jgi:NAD(P)-dependent dehydrogenase (short-subunit alcohol dehydrogenase family)
LQRAGQHRGILRPGALDTLSLAEWNSVLAVNLTGYFLCARPSAGRCARIAAAAWSI